MELSEIIKSTLSIFSVITFVLLLVSYTIYKVKDRTRKKPYLAVNTGNTSCSTMIDKNKLSLRPNLEERFAKENGPIGFVLAELPLHNRFNIINVNKPSVKLNKPNK
jgi:hypothetical protein